MGTVASRDGSVRLTTDTSGRPTDVHIDYSWRSKDGSALAKEILQLSELARVRDGVARRNELLEGGLSNEVVLSLGLPTPGQLAELESRFDDDGEVGSWLGRA